MLTVEDKLAYAERREVKAEIIRHYAAFDTEPKEPKPILPAILGGMAHAPVTALNLEPVEQK